MEIIGTLLPLAYEPVDSGLCSTFATLLLGFPSDHHARWDGLSLIQQSTVIRFPAVSMGFVMLYGVKHP